MGNDCFRDVSTLWGRLPIVDRTTFNVLEPNTVFSGSTAKDGNPRRGKIAIALRTVVFPKGLKKLTPGSKDSDMRLAPITRDTNQDHCGGKVRV